MRDVVTHVRSSSVNEEFSPEERARASAYHRPLYFALLVDLAISVALFAALAWSSLGNWFFSPLEDRKSVV